MAAANGASNQEWRVIPLLGGNYELVNVNSSLVLDVAKGGTTNGAKIDSYAYQGQTWQQWSFQSLQDQETKMKDSQQQASCTRAGLANTLRR